MNMSTANTARLLITCEDKPGIVQAVSSFLYHHGANITALVAEPGSTVTVTWPNGTTSTVTADPTTGAYEVESPTVQTNGNITATATDVNGNTSTIAF